MTDPVSRETGAVPAAAARLFSDRLPLAEAYVDRLAGDGVLRGLIGPREVPRLWERHLLNCAVISDLVPQDADVADIGSGAGLPGLVLAIRRPDLRVTLVEPLLRRTTFLHEVVRDLGLTHVVVHRGRAEELAGVREFAVVTSRAVAPLPRLLAWSLPLVRPGGTVLAMKGRSAEEELTAARSELRRAAVTAADVLQVGNDVIDPPTTVVRVETSPDARLASGTRAATQAGTSGRRSRSSRGGRPRGNPGSGG